MIIGIVGLGLIGGSMAKAVKKHTPYRALGMDQSLRAQQQAMAEGAMDGVLTDEAVETCDLIIMALYPGDCVDYLSKHAARIKKGACVVDVCGVKQLVCAAAAPLAERWGFHFVGGHPMAGKERSGYAASSADLFCGASMILTPGEDAPPAVVESLKAFFMECQFGEICVTSAAEHDQVIAYTSQLAHVVANAYVKSPFALHTGRFTGGSFQDMTRVATLNEDMWTELFMQNRRHLAGEIDALCARLIPYADALREADAGALKRLLREGCEWKAKSLQSKEERP